ncbi:MAG: hypothetical protein A2W19_07070 [Spirochaetes bacterium RBG_16_49_21]|nr:MAG: hypothetical protein A2W19_07070 [Spirochaetes bacterium RBG_16_49_21]
MIVRCTSCNTAFSVDDGKVENKRFAFTCPKCDNENMVDNRKGRRRAFNAPPAAAEAERGARKPAAVGQRARDEAFADASVEPADLPPMDDLSSELPLDDYYPESELDAQKIKALSREESPAATEMKLAPGGDESEKSVFEELGDISEFKSDTEMIKDEMESVSEIKDSGDFRESDIDELLSKDEQVIIDEFEPLTEEAAAAPGPDTKSPLEEEIKTEEVFPKDHTKEDESVTIDLDSLDIDIDQEAGDILKKKSEAPAESRDAEARVRSADAGLPREDDENITIDLDTLDIDVEEEKQISEGESRSELDLDISDFSEETIKELEDTTEKKDDEDLTLDLDSLDISLDESGETKEGEIVDEDEKLTLEDAGLSLDDLTTDELSSVSGDLEKTPEEDITLSLDEIDESPGSNTIDRELEEVETILSEPAIAGDERIEDFDELSEIDLDENLEISGTDEMSESFSISEPEDELIKIADRTEAWPKKGGLLEELSDIVPRGAINFSIDYSIKYSRIGALLRLSGLYFIGLIPHYVAFFVYHLLSFILGFLNYIIIMFTGKNVEDFSEIQENSLRYLLSISSSLIGIVDETPVFAGRSNIDHPIQMRITYPPGYSRSLAFLRITIVGIILAAAPHLMVLILLGAVLPVLSLVGLLSVLVTGRWPHPLFDFMTRYHRYAAAVLAFSIGIIDEYPAFRFK